LMLANGKGVAQDYKAAARWYRIEAGNGNPDAQFNLGLMYLFGIGVDTDHSIGEKWIYMAGQTYADQGRWKRVLESIDAIKIFNDENPLAKKLYKEMYNGEAKAY
ncbi:MAG: sel1 repeat family protein, partial [Nitrospinota bacterium]|nr:sel1 repeat family protein [Nitrospinota bacterium]